MFGNSKSKIIKTTSLVITVLISTVLILLATLLLILTYSDELRAKGFANFCSLSGTKSSPLDVDRCDVVRLAHGKVIEFGPGPGTNFKCFENETTSTAQQQHSIESWVGVEPNLHFVEGLQKEKESRGLDFPLNIVGLKGEEIDLTDDDHFSYDTVIMTHVLCSVDSVETVLDNAERSLKSGGRILFLEHVPAEDGTMMSVLQSLIGPVLYIVGNGCKFKDTETIIRNHLGDRFDIQLSKFNANVPKLLYFITPHIKGFAIKK